MGTAVIPEMKGLTFEPETHTYRLDGAEIPGVTTIMAPLSGVKYGGVSRTVLDRAAARGTTVHNTLENWIKFGIEDCPPEQEPCFSAFLEWWEKNSPEVLGSEVRLYHRYLQYAGTADLVANIGGVLTLVDFKTTSTVSDMLCGVQLEAYSQALRSHGLNVEDKRILQLRKDGTYAERIYPVMDPVRWKVFGSLKTVYDYVLANSR